MQDESQAPKRFLNFFPQDIENLILAKLHVNDVKSVSAVSRDDYACTTRFIATRMVRFWGGERIKMTTPAALKYHYSCAQYYAACSEPRKSKALMRFFSMLMADLMENYGKRLKQCITFNREELPERLGLTCKNNHLLLDVSAYLLEKFNCSLEFFDANNTTQAILTREHVEQHCTTMLFQTVVYDFLKPADLIKISTRFLDTTLFAAELELVDQNGWELFRPRVIDCYGSDVQLTSSQTALTCARYLLSKLYLADDRIDVNPGQKGVVEVGMCLLECQPGFFTEALELIQPLIRRILLENIPPDAVEKALETEFAEYKKPAPAAKKNDNCCVM